MSLPSQPKHRLAPDKGRPETWRIQDQEAHDGTDGDLSLYLSNNEGDRLLITWKVGCDPVVMWKRADEYGWYPEDPGHA